MLRGQATQSGNPNPSTQTGPAPANELFKHFGFAEENAIRAVKA